MARRSSLLSLFSPTPSHLGGAARFPQSFRRIPSRQHDEQGYNRTGHPEHKAIVYLVRIHCCACSSVCTEFGAATKPNNRVAIRTEQIAVVVIKLLSALAACNNGPSVPCFWYPAPWPPTSAHATSHASHFFVSDSRMLSASLPQCSARALSEPYSATKGPVVNNAFLESSCSKMRSRSWILKPSKKSCVY